MDWLAGKVNKLRGTGGAGSDFVGSSIVIAGQKLRIKRALAEGTVSHAVEYWHILAVSGWHQRIFNIG